MKATTIYAAAFILLLSACSQEELPVKEEQPPKETEQLPAKDVIAYGNPYLSFSEFSTKNTELEFSAKGQQSVLTFALFRNKKINGVDAGVEKCKLSNVNVSADDFVTISKEISKDSILTVRISSDENPTEQERTSNIRVSVNGCSLELDLKQKASEICYSDYEIVTGTEQDTLVFSKSGNTVRKLKIGISTTKYINGRKTDERRYISGAAKAVKYVFPARYDVFDEELTDNDTFCKLSLKCPPNTGKKIYEDAKFTYDSGAESCSKILKLLSTDTFLVEIVTNK